MDQKMQLKHPQDKKPVSMSKKKYEMLKSLLLKYFRTKGKATFNEISKAIEKDLRTNGTKFQGSLTWYLEWVKLDLEARKIIERVADTSPRQYMILS